MKWTNTTCSVVDKISMGTLPIIGKIPPKVVFTDMVDAYDENGEIIAIKNTDTNEIYVNTLHYKAMK